MAELRLVSSLPRALYLSKVEFLFDRCCDGGVAASCRHGYQLGEDQATVGLQFGEKLITGPASQAIRNSMICGFVLEFCFCFW